MKSNFNLIYSNDLKESMDKIYPIIKAFVSFCYDELSINSDTNIFIISGNDRNKPNMSLACFDLSTKDTWVRGDNRCAIDICRSIAHELTHLQQLEDDRINLTQYTDIGGDIEDEANAVAGQLCKMFVKKYNCSWLYKF